MKPIADITEIKDWGIDNDPANQPAYPMKHTNDADLMGMEWQRPPLQQPQEEILHSIERPGLTAVFGTSAPPSGLSGMLRRHAFKHSESTYAHWLPLMLADRINVVEGIIDDLRHGRLPNLFKEMGLKSELRHNPKGFAKKVAIGAIATYVVVKLVRRRRRARRA